MEQMLLDLLLSFLSSMIAAIVFEWFTRRVSPLPTINNKTHWRIWRLRPEQIFSRLQGECPCLEGFDQATIKPLSPFLCKSDSFVNPSFRSLQG